MVGIAQPFCEVVRGKQGADRGRPQELHARLRSQAKNGRRQRGSLSSWPCEAGYAKLLFMSSRRQANRASVSSDGSWSASATSQPRRKVTSEGKSNRGLKSPRRHTEIDLKSVMGRQCFLPPPWSLSWPRPRPWLPLSSGFPWPWFPWPLLPPWLP